ncbi:MAG: biotin--[Clostridia bacterium]|nr:biotin--[acetyl-CoA-carboxylase] ligase [Clostridia bacterium]
MSFEIDKNSILNLLKSPLNIEVVDEVTSTNDYIKGRDLFSVIAKQQSNGRGTNNRSFYSQKGGIYLSVKLPIELEGDDFLLLTPFVAVITARAIDKVVGVNTQIKWVNDIYLNGKKLGGILCENVLKGRVSEVVIGIGVNVEKQAFPSFNLNAPISLEEVVENIDKNRLIAELLNGFIGFEGEFKSRGFLSEYNDRFYLKNKVVSLSQNGQTFVGEAVGINERASLILKVGSDVKSFVHGDVIINL